MLKVSATSTSLRWQYLDVCSVVLAVAGLYGGTALGETLKDFSYEFSWVMAGLDAAGGAMKFVGFAILMKVMMSGEMWGFLLAGFAMALICSSKSHQQQEQHFSFVHS